MTATVYLKTGDGYREITQARIDRIAKRIAQKRSVFFCSCGEIKNGSGQLCEFCQHERMLELRRKNYYLHQERNIASSKRYYRRHRNEILAKMKAKRKHLETSNQGGK